MTSLINNTLADYQYVVLDFEDILSVDISVVSALEDILKSLVSGRSIKIKIRKNEVYLMLSSLSVLNLLPPENIIIIDENGNDRF